MMKSNIDNETTRFIKYEWNWGRSHLELQPLDPQHGGVRITLLRFWEAYITHITPTGKEKKFKMFLNAEERKALIRLFITHNFLAIRPETQPGRPKAARASLTLTNVDGDTHTVTGTAGDGDPDFEAIYTAVRALAERRDKLRPIRPRFNLLQTGLFFGALSLLALLPLPLALRLAGGWVSRFWPEQPGLLLLGLLFGGGLALAGLVALWRYEHGPPREIILTSLPVLGLVNFSLFLMSIAGFDMIIVIINSWLGAGALEPGDDGRLTQVIGYAALLMIPYFLALAGVIGRRVKVLLEERF